MAVEVKNNKKVFFDLLPADKVTEINITSNFDSIKANIRNKEYEDGIFEVKHSRKSSTKFSVRLRPRGKSRRMICEFPPLKLKFHKDSLNANGFESFNEYKLVTHCMENDGSEVNIIREYLVYQLFRLLTPYSFKASLAEITYRNTGKSFKKTTQLGIIIEDAESMAARNNCHTMSRKIIQLDSLHLNQEKIMSVFQYMVGNADWSYMMARNTELIQQEDGQIVPVPYDFDYAGLVAAPYARANAALGQKTVLDRVFLGNAKSYEELRVIFSYFKSKKEAIISTIDDFDRLDMETKTEMINYLEGFFELIEDKNRVETEMLGVLKKG
ncbi:MAG: hypothetical protein GC192_18810 [Bacteroidetes bacterium]|nr:hypothetical protein [Bacteroidota bacterium]